MADVSSVLYSTHCALNSAAAGFIIDNIHLLTLLHVFSGVI